MRIQALRARPRRRRLPPDLGERQATAVAVNAASTVPTCAEVKFPRQQVAVISRRRDRMLRLLVGDRVGVPVVSGLAY
jgi:hypothetical protein